MGRLWPSGYWDIIPSFRSIDAVLIRRKGFTDCGAMFGAVRIPLNAKGPKMAFKDVLIVIWAFIRFWLNNGSAGLFRGLYGVLRHSVKLGRRCVCCLGALCGF